MKSNRRSFVSAMVAAPLFVPASAFGANERLQYGVIAVGGRGRYLNRKFKELGARCVAVCDVYEPHIALALKDTPDVKTYVEYRELLENKDVEAVVIASPDHHHCQMMLDSLSAHKDIYAEKPLSKTLEESAKMVQAVRKSKQIVQIGMQRRSAESIFKAKKVVDDGTLGRVTLVKAQWHWNIAKPLNNSPLEGNLDWNRFLGKARKRELEPMRFRSWRYFFDYAGGNMTDQGTHLMDVVQWFMKSGPPKSAIAHGYVAKMQGAEHPDVFCAVFEYPDFMASWTLDYANSYQNGWSITFMGDKATLILDDAGFVVYEEPWKRENPPLIQEKAPVPVESHIQNFIDCVKSRKEPNCTVEIAAQAVAGPHLANLAMFKGRKVALSDFARVS
ncbi:MAG: Gfo/Idh/MocA family oxidoreductase [Bryobacteraceae bacterium]|nr:Gfo/Idh/MocA family oxidoreductase [Bryobacteraceae bacterium]MDW8380008.1 Gfo/Idh/MocA family oxidoreductase [Bryobacterales bacterium]